MEWTLMEADDLDGVDAIATAVHPGFPEGRAVFAERLDLCPAGCFVLRKGDELLGYGVGHPWHLSRVPQLNSLLTAIPEPATTFHIHDVALLPAARGSGAGSEIVARFVGCATALRLPSLALVAVGGSIPFWERHGFRTPGPQPELSTYGTGARYLLRPVPPSLQA